MSILRFIESTDLFNKKYLHYMYFNIPKLHPIFGLEQTTMWAKIVFVVCERVRSLVPSPSRVFSKPRKEPQKGRKVREYKSHFSREK
jgi:hypothetical protein